MSIHRVIYKTKCTITDYTLHLIACQGMLTASEEQGQVNKKMETRNVPDGYKCPR